MAGAYALWRVMFPSLLSRVHLPFRRGIVHYYPPNGPSRYIIALEKCGTVKGCYDTNVTGSSLEPPFFLQCPESTPIQNILYVLLYELLAGVDV